MPKALFPAFALVLALIASYVGYRLASPRAVRPLNDTPAAHCSLAATTLRDATGKPVNASAWRGHTVLLNFWASWCSHCRTEMPALETISRQYAARGVRVIGVAVDHPETAERFAHTVGADYPMLYGLEAAHALLNRCVSDAPGLPVSLVLDRDGGLCASHIGGLDRQGFVNLLQPCLSPRNKK